MENLQKTQHESFEDYSKQASNASKIANQLEQTRIEAERVAREEMNRTKMMQARLLNEGEQKRKVIQDQIDKLEAEQKKVQERKASILARVKENENIMEGSAKDIASLDEDMKVIEAAKLKASGKEPGLIKEKRDCELKVRNAQDQLSKLDPIDSRNLGNLKFQQKQTLETFEALEKQRLERIKEKDECLFKMENLSTSIEDAEIERDSLNDLLVMSPIENLKNEVHDARTKCASAKKLCDSFSSMKREVTGLHEEREKIKAKMERLEKRLMEITDILAGPEKVELENRLADAESVWNKAKVILDEKIKTFEIANEEYIESTEKLDSLEKLIKESHEEKGELGINLDRIDEGLKNTETSMEQLNHLLESLANRMSALDIDAKRYEDERGKIDSEIEQSRFELEKAIQELDDHEKHMFSLSKSFNELQAKRQGLVNFIISVESDNESWQKQAETDDKEDAVLQTRISDLRDQLNRLTWNADSTAWEEQLKREAEAVLRAEAAHYLESQQKEIVEKTNALASIKLTEKPRIFIDQEAKHYLQLKQDRKKIGKTIIELLEEQHIKKV